MPRGRGQSRSSWLRGRNSVVLGFQHGLHQCFEGPRWRHPGLRMTGIRFPGPASPIAATVSCSPRPRDSRGSATPSSPLQEVGGASCHGKKRDEIVKALRIRQRSCDKVRSSAVRRQSGYSRPVQRQEKAFNAARDCRGSGPTAPGNPRAGGSTPRRARGKVLTVFHAPLPGDASPVGPTG